MINSCTEVWQAVCRELGWRIDESIQDASHWKGVYLKAKLRMMQLKGQEAFETSSLIGHSARVYALYYKDGLLCTGTLSLWFIFSGGKTGLESASSYMYVLNLLICLGNYDQRLNQYYFLYHHSF